MRNFITTLIPKIYYSYTMIKFDPIGFNFKDLKTLDIVMSFNKRTDPRYSRIDYQW